MFVLRNKLTVGFLIYCLQKQKKNRFNHVNQCKKLITHSLPQILNQNDKNGLNFQSVLNSEPK